MTTLHELQSRLKALVTMHADTLTAEERHAWIRERELLRELSQMLIDRLNARRNRASAGLETRP